MTKISDKNLKELNEVLNKSDDVKPSKGRSIEIKDIKSRKEVQEYTKAIYNVYDRGLEAQRTLSKGPDGKSFLGRGWSLKELKGLEQELIFKSS